MSPWFQFSHRAVDHSGGDLKDSSFGDFEGDTY